MFFSSDYSLAFTGDMLKSADYPDFEYTVQKSLNDVADKAPANSYFSLIVSAENNMCVVVFRILSENLIIEEKSEGKTPYTALDKVVKRVTTRLDIWAAEKNIA